MKFRKFKTEPHVRARNFANRWRDFPTNTCPSSRHTQKLGEELARGKIPWMVGAEPEHVAYSLLATVGALYKSRTQLKRVKKQLAKVRAG